MASPLGTAALERSCANSTALCNILTAAVLIVFGRDLLIPAPAVLPLAAGRLFESPCTHSYFNRLSHGRFAFLTM